MLLKKEGKTMKYPNNYNTYFEKHFFTWLFLLKDVSINHTKTIRRFFLLLNTLTRTVIVSSAGADSVDSAILLLIMIIRML